MWTVLRNSDYDIAIVPRAYDIKVDNVLVLQNSTFHFITPLQNLDTSVYGGWSKIGHPVLEFFKYKNEHKANMFIVINGRRRNEWLCCICKKKFMGLTGTCKLDADKFSEEHCVPEFEIRPKPPILQVRGGMYIPSKFFHKDFKKYSRDKTLEDFDFSLKHIEAVIEQLTTEVG